MGPPQQYDENDHVPGSVTNVELVSPDSNKNPKGQQGGTFNVKDGTLYFVNGTCGRKRYYPYTQDEMEAGFDKHKVEGYWDLFTGKYGQPEHLHLVNKRKQF